MAKKTNLLDSLMESSGNKMPGSALDLVGVKNDSDDLLDKAVKGKLEPPAPHSAFPESDVRPGFADAKESARDFFKQAYGTESEAAKKEVEATNTIEKAAEEAAPEQIDTPEVSEAKKDEVPDWWHTLNNETQAQRERQDTFERALLQQQQQVLKTIEQRQPQGDPRDEQMAAQYGFETVDQYRQFKEIWRKDMQEEIARQQAPIMQQMIYDRYGAAVARAEADMPNFAQYFPKAKTSAYISQLMQQYPPTQLARVNWEQEFANAYRAADYDRLKREFERVSQTGDTVTKAKEEEKAKKKADLKLVPKANQQGAALKHGLAEDLDALPSNLSISQFGREMKSRLFNR